MGELDAEKRKEQKKYLEYYCLRISQIYAKHQNHR